MKKCEKCGQDLGIVYWTSGKIMAICCNGQCQAYRNPINPASSGDWGSTFTSLTPYNHRITLSEGNNYSPEDFNTVCRDLDIQPRLGPGRSSKLNRHTTTKVNYPTSQQISRHVKKIFSWIKTFKESC